jgi:hypothetical protein
VAWYRFEDSAITAIDATNALGVGADQTGFDGTVNGASFVQNGGVTDVVSGPNSGAYDFDGVDDHIDLPQNLYSFVSPSGGVTHSVFLKADKLQDDFILDARNPVQQNIRIRSNGEIVFQIFSGSAEEIVSTTSYSTGAFTHIAASWSNNDAELFINGVSEASATFSDANSGNFDIRLGDAGDTPQNFNGTIDDYRTYNRALSASEINRIYQNTDPDQ